MISIRRFGLIEILLDSASHFSIHFPCETKQILSIHCDEVRVESKILFTLLFVLFHYHLLKVFSQF